jgi:hypothetical protein
LQGLCHPNTGYANAVRIVFHKEVLIGVFPVLQARVLPYRKGRGGPYPGVFPGAVPADEGLIFLQIIEAAKMLYLKAEPVELTAGQQYFFPPFMDGPFDTYKYGLFVNKLHNHQGGVYIPRRGQIEDNTQ